MKRVLMVAYHFPPLAGSSGIQRTLRFVQHLPKFGWEPIVLSADTRAYERTSDDLLSEIPAGIVVKRAFALDTARHLSVGGRYMASMARPDRWMSWRFAAIRDGMQLIKQYRPNVLWSTFPIATAHVIGAELHRRSGLPWIADFRDPMAQETYPPDPVTRDQFRKIESVAVHQAEASLFTTPGAARIYRQRYPERTNCIHVLENGYDEESFLSAAQPAGNLEPLNPGAITLVHSGIIYPSERDPTALFRALQHLKASGQISAGKLIVRFRAAVHDDLLRSLARQYRVESFIDISPAISYKDALIEMQRADGLLVMQAANCNEQIPAKIYEYLRAKRPILGLTDIEGDTAGILRAAGIKAIAPLDSPHQIAALLSKTIRSETQQLFASEAFVTGASRYSRTQVLANIFDRIFNRQVKDS